MIVIDAFFTPIERVNYRVENARVGQATDYDRLVIEVWTNGGVGPEEALAHAGRILREHLAIFVGDEEEFVSEDRAGETIGEDALRNLDRSVNELELSVRAANCLKNVELRRSGTWCSRARTRCSRPRTSGASHSTRSRKSSSRWGCASA